MKSWVKSLSLSKLDESILVDGKDLTANHMFSGQLLLKQLYPLQEHRRGSSGSTEPPKFLLCGQLF